MGTQVDFVDRDGKRTIFTAYVDQVPRVDDRVTHYDYEDHATSAFRVVRVTWPFGSARSTHPEGAVAHVPAVVLEAVDE